MPGKKNKHVSYFNCNYNLHISLTWMEFYYNIMPLIQFVGFEVKL